MSDKSRNGAGGTADPAAPAAGEAGAKAGGGDDIEVQVDVSGLEPMGGDGGGSDLDGDDADDPRTEFDGGADTTVDASTLSAARDPRVGLTGEDWAELVGELEREKESLTAEKEALANEKRDIYDRLVRTTADMENLRKRTRKEIDDARLDARGRVVKEVLPVIDNLDRAVAHASEATDVAGVIEGIQLVLRQFGQALERCDVKPVEAEGKPFDPNLHEAVAQAESQTVDPGTIVEVLQRGYTIGPRLLRPSLVVVAKAPAQAAAAEADAAAVPIDNGGMDSGESDTGETRPIERTPNSTNGSEPEQEA